MFFRILRFDIKYGVLRRFWIYILVFVFFLVANFILYMHHVNMSVSNPALANDSFTLGDMIIHIVGGSKRFVTSDATNFSYPILWMISIFIVLFINLRYPIDELFDYGRHIMILSGNRRLWWVSKCCWLLLSVALYYLILALSITMFGGIVKADCSFYVSEFLLQLLMIDYREVLYQPWDLITPLLVHIFSIFTLCMVQMLLSLYIKPVISFFAVAATTILSVFFSSPFLVNSYAMVLRTDKITVIEPLSTKLGFALCIIMCLMAFIIGTIRINKLDVLSKED